MALLGRIRIYTDVKEIDKDNVLAVLQNAYAIHRQNAADIQFLIGYERGIQPLKREKAIRPDINIISQDNLANYVKEFKVGYFWGTPAMLVQRGNNESHNTDPDVDDTGISALNEMLQNGNMIGKLDQELAEFVEISGIGYRIVDVKTDFEDEENINTYVNLYTLDPRTTFCVYYNGIGNKKVLGVTYNKTKTGKIIFTCFTDKYQFTISGGQITDETVNPFGIIPIVEYDRAVDRTGCFERQIPLMDNLNIMVSDFANDVSQKTQEVWWGNDVDFPKDKTTGEDVTPSSGQWVLTFSGEGKNPKIAPLSSSFDSNSTLNAIGDTRTKILQNCKVPVQYDSTGGGSTGIATTEMSGWSAAEVDALRQECLIECGRREELGLILKAISLVSTDILPADNVLRLVHGSDCSFRFNRKRNYSMSEKANTLSALLSHGINGRHALKTVDMFEDTQQVWNDSKEGIERYQEYTYGGGATNDQGMQDSSDQEATSPFVGSMITLDDDLS